MEEYQKEIGQIKELLGEHPEGLSITAISGELGINRNSIAKYMDILQIQGSVDGRKIGTSKIYYISERLPASSIQRFCTRPLLIVNHELQVTDLNKAFSDYLGTPRDRILSQSFESLPFRFLEGGNQKQVMRGALRGMEQRVHAQRLNGGHSQTVTLLFVPIVFDNGKPGVSMIIDDKDGQVFDNRKAPDPSDLGVLDSQIEYTVRHTPDGIIQFANEAYCRAVGKTREDLVGRPFKPLVSPEDADRISGHLNGLTIQYPVGMIEYSAVMASGEVRWQRWQDRAVFNGRGELTGYYSCGFDISELVFSRLKLKKTQEMLEDTIANRTDELRTINSRLYSEIAQREKIEQQLLHTQFAMDNAPDIIFWVNRNARVQYANHMALKVLGYQGNEIQEISLGDIVPAFRLSKWDAVWDQLKDEGSITREVTVLRKDGSDIPTEMVIKYLEYHGKEFACSFSRNISDRTRMEHALQQANKKLNLLTSTTRHDIHNKITVLLGFLGRARKRVKDPVVIDYLDRQEKAAKEIRNEIQLTREFKDLGTEPPLWLNIRNVAHIASDYFADEDEINFVIDLPEIEVFAEKNLERVFYHLIKNLVRARKGPEFVKITTEEKESHLLIVVQDDGTGYKDNEKDSIFDLSRIEREYYDLYIAREILSLTGFTISEHGVHGQGTRFEIGVPRSYYRWAPAI